MIDQVDLLKFAANVAGIPPKKFGWILYDYGGLASLPSATWPAVVSPYVRGELVDAVIAHAKRRRNAVLITWLNELPAFALWRWLPPPKIKSRIIIIDDWGRYRESRDNVFAVAWIKTDCCMAFAWSYPYAALKSMKMRYIAPVLW